MEDEKLVTSPTQTPEQKRAEAIASFKDELAINGLKVEMEKKEEQEKEMPIEDLQKLNDKIQDNFLKHIETCFQEKLNKYPGIKTKEQFITHLMRFETQEDTKYFFETLMTGFQDKMEIDTEIEGMVKGITEKMPGGFGQKILEFGKNSWEDIQTPFSSMKGLAGWAGLLGLFGYVGSSQKGWDRVKEGGGYALGTSAVLVGGKPLVRLLGLFLEGSREAADFAMNPLDSAADIIRDNVGDHKLLDGFSKKLTLERLLDSGVERSKFLPKEIAEINNHILEGDKNYMFAPSQIRAAADFVYQTSDLEMTPEEIANFQTNVANGNPNPKDTLRVITIEARKTMVNYFMVKATDWEKDQFSAKWQKEDDKFDPNLVRRIELGQSSYIAEGLLPKLKAGELSFADAEKMLSKIPKKELAAMEKDLARGLTGNVMMLAFFIFSTLLVGKGLLRTVQGGKDWLVGLGKKKGEKARMVPSAKETSKESKKTLSAIFLGHKIVRIPPFPTEPKARFLETLKELKKAEIIDKSQTEELEDKLARSSTLRKRFFSAFNSKEKLKFLDGPLASARENFWTQFKNAKCLIGTLQIEKTQSPFFIMLDKRKEIENGLKDKMISTISVVGVDDKTYSFTEMKKVTLKIGMAFKAKSPEFNTGKEPEIFALIEKDGEMYLRPHSSFLASQKNNLKSKIETDPGLKKELKDTSKSQWQGGEKPDILLKEIKLS